MGATFKIVSIRTVRQFEPNLESVRAVQEKRLLVLLLVVGE